MKIYLDVDGVLVMHGEKTLHSDEFIKYLVKNFDCYWLTTNVKGNTDFVLNRLKDIFSPETMEYLKKLKPTDWGTLKTDAINFDEDFWWFEDYVLEKELEVLKEKGKEKCLVQIGLKDSHFYKKNKFISSLEDVINLIKTKQK